MSFGNRTRIVGTYRPIPAVRAAKTSHEDRFFLYFALQAMRRGDLLVYGPTIPKITQTNLPFVKFVESLEADLEYTKSKFPRKASVLIFPYGGNTYPILPK